MQWVNLGRAVVPFLLTELGLTLKPAEKSRVWSQTVAVTGWLEQLNLSYHLKLLQRPKEKSSMSNLFNFKHVVIVSCSSCDDFNGIILSDEADCCYTYPASLLKVDQSPLQRTQRARCQTLNVTYQWLLGQTALGGPLQKRADKIPHELMETYAPVSGSGYTYRLWDQQSCVHSQTHALKYKKSTHIHRHTGIHNTLSRCFLVPLLSQVGLYPT